MEIYNEIISLTAEILEINSNNLNRASSVGKVENWDSIHQLMLITAIEEKYKISFPEDSLFDMISIGDIVDATEKQIKG